MTKLLHICLMAFSLISFSAHATTYQSIAGEEISIDFNQVDKPTLLIFWASWCPTCMKEIPHLKELHEQYPNVEFLGVNLNKHSEDGLRVQKKRELPWESIADPSLAVAAQFGVRGTPGLFLVAPEGKLLFKGRTVNSQIKSKLSELAR